MNSCMTNFTRAVGTVVCAFALGWVAIATVPAAAQSARTPRVAVLPLDNGSQGPTQGFVANGMTDEIASALTRIRGLAVVARSSAFMLKPANGDAKTAGAELHADYLVQGSAQSTGDRTRLSLRLVRASDARQLWAQDYDPEALAIFDVEQEIARSVATALQVPVTADAAIRSRTHSFASYLDFLRAKDIARGRGPRALADAAVILEQVVMREPDFAPAAALLAYGDALTPLFAPSLRGGMPQEERKVVERTVPRSDALAHRATELDPGNADGFVALGYADMVQRKPLPAEDAFKQALALNPNQADGLHGYSQLVAALGRIKKSLAMRDHLQDVEQSIINYTADTAEIVWLDGDTEKAIAMLKPFSPGRTLELALIEASAGRYREAAAEIRFIPASNYPPGMEDAAAKLLEFRARPRGRTRNLAAAWESELCLPPCRRPGTCAGILSGRSAGRLFPADLRDLVLAPELRPGSTNRAVQNRGARPRLCRLLACQGLAGAMPAQRRGGFRLSVRVQRGRAAG